MGLILVITAGLWFNSNADFVKTANENREAGKTWHYVGKQSPDGSPALTITGANGNEFILWKQKD